MIIIKLQGGLGNQIFQYAFGRALALKYNCDLHIDAHFLNIGRFYSLNCFNLKVKFIPLWLSKIINSRSLFFKRIYFSVFKIKLYKENSFSFSNLNISINDTLYFDGYWQSEKFFLPFEQTLRRDLEFGLTLSEKLRKMKTLMLNSESVSIHVRRGDYVTNKIASDVLGVCSLNYYKNAVELITSRISIPIFFIFTDDPGWVKENFFLKDNYYIVSTEGADPAVDLNLMSSCKHNIIANSTFSWWGAWLNRNKHKIIIAPKQWYRDSNYDDTNLIPDTWLRL